MDEFAKIIHENVSQDLLKSIKQALEKTDIPELATNAWELDILREVKQQDRLAISIVLPTFGLASEKHIALNIKKALVKFVADPSRVDLFVYSEVRPAAVQSIKKDDFADVRNIILVSSGKGGVGKSTVASNLAVTLAQLGCRVGLLDADVYGPSVPIMFDLKEEGQVKGISDKNSGATYMVPPIKYDTALMSVGFLVDTESPMIWRGPMIAQASMQMFHNVYWGQLDYLIVDLPPGTGDIQLTIAQKINIAGAIIVSTPQDVALGDVVRAKKMFDKVHIPVLGVIENMSYFTCDGCEKRHEIFSTGGARLRAKKLGLEVLGELPLEPSMRVASDAGKPYVLSQPESSTSKIFKNIAHLLCAKIYQLSLQENLANNSEKNNINKTQIKKTPAKPGRLPVL